MLEHQNRKLIPGFKKYFDQRKSSNKLWNPIIYLVRKSIWNLKNHNTWRKETTERIWIWLSPLSKKIEMFQLPQSFLMKTAVLLLFKISTSRQENLSSVMCGCWTTILKRVQQMLIISLHKRWSKSELNHTLLLLSKDLLSVKTNK